MRFLADSMLGTLAKWLRILGYDTTYYAHLDDNEALRLARAERRILLTRDTGFRGRKGLRYLLIESEVLEEQIVQVLQAFDLRPDKEFSRCPVCNVPIEEVPKHEAWGQVPPFIFQTHEHLSLCPECSRFYWRGTHWQRMLDTVKRLSRSEARPLAPRDAVL